MRQLLSLVLLGCSVSAQNGWQLIWSDEFNGAAGTPPDGSKWVHDLGASGWGNRELQNYTDSRENTAHDGKGNLAIRALKSPSGQYTSGRITTKGKFGVLYGRIEARIKLPYGQGIWPAFWMMGTNIDQAGWPEGGEIDIMENIGKEPNIVHGTVHGPGYSGGKSIGGQTERKGARFADAFHVYGGEWSPGAIAFFVDGKEYFRFTPQSVPEGGRWVFDHPHFILLNVAVGGNWPGFPDSGTVFPQTMLVDWVRVSQRR